jgi:hypothetical protein
MDTDRSGRTLKAYRDLFWKAEKRIRELEAALLRVLVAEGSHLPTSLLQDIRVLLDKEQTHE